MFKYKWKNPRGEKIPDAFECTTKGFITYLKPLESDSKYAVLPGNVTESLRLRSIDHQLDFIIMIDLASMLV